MTSNLDRDGTDPERLLVMRTEDGAWYELPATELDRMRVTDPALLDEVRGQLVAAGITVTTPEGALLAIAPLSDETLAAHRVGADRAAELEAASDVAGFTEPQSQLGSFVILGNHKEIVVSKGVAAGPPGPGGSQSITFVPTVVLATPPGVRFGGDTPFLAIWNLLR